MNRTEAAYAARLEELRQAGAPNRDDATAAAPSLLKKFVRKARPWASGAAFGGVAVGLAIAAWALRRRFDSGYSSANRSKIVARAAFSSSSSRSGVILATTAPQLVLREPKKRSGSSRATLYCVIGR